MELTPLTCSLRISEASRSFSEARVQIGQQLAQRAHLEQMLVPRLEESDWKRALAEKEDQVVSLSDKKSRNLRKKDYSISISWLWLSCSWHDD